MANCRVTIRARIEWDDPKAVRAVKVPAKTLQDLHEDFGYRDDVKRALRAAKYAIRHLRVRTR